MKAMRACAGLVLLAACGAGPDRAGQARGEEAFRASCESALVANNPNMAGSAAEAQCAQNWAQVAEAAPMAEALLAAAPVSGSADAASVGARFADGRLRDKVRAEIEAPSRVVSALAQAGADTAMIGCAQLGVGEFQKAYRVSAPERAPFMLSIYERTAPTANASSFYNVSLDLSGQTRTLDQLAADGMSWAQACR